MKELANVDLKHLAYTLHSWTEECRAAKVEPDTLVYRELWYSTAARFGYSKEFADILSLGIVWSSDTVEWIAEQFEIERNSNSTVGWSITDLRNDHVILFPSPFGDNGEKVRKEYFECFDKFIQSRYAEYLKEKGIEHKHQES